MNTNTTIKNKEEIINLLNIIETINQTTQKITGALLKSVCYIEELNHRFIEAKKSLNDTYLLNEGFKHLERNSMEVSNE